MTDFDLLTEDEARTALGEERYTAAIESGDLRIVQLDGEDRVLGVDLKKVVRDMDPRYAAKKVPRFNGATPDSDDPDSPRNLAAQLPRL